MLVDPKSPKAHHKRCERCSCPLYLLKTEKWKWENRRLCSRCSTPKNASLLIDRMMSEATEGSKRYGLKKVLDRLPKGGPLPKERKPPKLRNRLTSSSE